MRLNDLFESRLEEIDKYGSGGDLGDGWEERQGHFAPEELGIKPPADPNQPDLFPDSATQMKPGASPFRDRTPYVKIGNIGDYSVGRRRVPEDGIGDTAQIIPETHPDHVLIVVFDAIIPVGYIEGDFSTASMEGEEALKVEGVRIDKAYAGKGIGLQLYRWVLTHVTEWIEADNTHTAAGAKVWEKFVTSPDFEVYHEVLNAEPESDEEADWAEWKRVDDLPTLARCYELDDSYLWVRLAQK